MSALLLGALSMVSQGGCSASDDEAGPGKQAQAPGEGAQLPSGEIFTRAKLLEAAGLCIGAQLKLFHGQTEKLKQELGLVAGSTASDAELAAVQRAWQQAMDTWQRLELMQVGPLAIKAQPGGADLRDQIYAWPLINTCGVDELLVSQGYAAPTFGNTLISVRGLGALEHLLFHDAETSACSASARIITDGSWQALGAEELKERRLAYSKAAAADLLSRAEQASAAWNSEESGFIKQFTSAGSGSRYYGSARLALNALSDALFYIEWGTKDAKLGAPSGLTLCNKASCPELLESGAASYSKQNIRNNLIGFQKVFSGCGERGEGLGFDDFLYAVGAPEVAEAIEAGVLAALEALDAIEEDDLAAVLVNDLASVHQLHAELKRVTDRLRTQFVTVLDLEIPKRVEGDND